MDNVYKNRDGRCAARFVSSKDISVVKKFTAKVEGLKGSQLREIVSLGKLWSTKESRRHQAFYSICMTAPPHAAIRVKAMTILNTFALRPRNDWLCGLCYSELLRLSCAEIWPRMFEMKHKEVKQGLFGKVTALYHVCAAFC